MTARPPVWRRQHRTIAERTAQLRIDRYKYGYRSLRMDIATVVRVSAISPSLDVTLPAVRFLLKSERLARV